MGNLAYKNAIFDPTKYKVEDAQVTKAWVADRKRRKTEAKQQKIIQFRQAEARRKKKKLEEQKRLGKLSIACCLISALIGKMYCPDMWLLSLGFGVVGGVMIIATLRGKIVIY